MNPTPQPNTFQIRGRFTRIYLLTKQSMQKHRGYFQNESILIFLEEKNLVTHFGISIWRAKRITRLH